MLCTRIVTMSDKPKEAPPEAEPGPKSGERSASRRAYLVAAGSASVAATAGCLGGITGGGGGSGKPDFIRFIGWGGNTQESAKKLFKKWSDKTGIEVKHQTAGGDSAIVSQIKQNPGSFDFANLSSYGITLARNENLLGTVNYDQLPNYTENIQEDFRNAPYIQQADKNDTIFRDPLTQGYAYTTEMVDKKLTTWDDLLEINGQISLRDDALSRFANTALDVDTNVTSILSNDSGGFKKTVDRMKEYNNKVSKYWGSGAQAIRLLREGNVPVAEIWGGRTLALKEAGYDQMEYVIPEEGGFPVDENYVIPKASEKKKTVHELLNWSYQRQNAIELSKNLGYPIMVKNPPKAITSLPDYAPSIEPYQWPDYNVVLPKLERLQRNFQQVKQS